MNKQKELINSMSVSDGLTIKHIGPDYLNGTEIGIGDGAEKSRNQRLPEYLDLWSRAQKLQNAKND